MSRLPQLRLTLLERLLVRVAPAWTMRRVRARYASQLLPRARLLAGRHYKAASSGRRTDDWYRNSGDANSVPAPTVQTLRDLSRDLVRNNGLAKRAVNVIVTNTIGWGIAPKPVGPHRQEARRLWNDWAASTACDYDGLLPLAGVQAMALRTVVNSGAALVAMTVDSEAEEGTIPLRLRVLEPDYLDTSKDGALPNGRGRISQGIEIDARGRRVAYHLYQEHPGATNRLVSDSRRVPADEVLHIYDPDRPGALQGVPWAAAAMPKLNDLEEYEDAALMQKKIAAMFAAFVEDIDGLGAGVGELPGGEEADSEDAELLETFEPGQIQYLPSGKKITFATPPQHADHDQFTKGAARRIAAAYDITYEDLTGDYSQVNYSSARMARLAFYRQVHAWRWNMFIPQFCAGVWRRAMSLLALERDWQNVPTAEWTPPPMPMLDPDREGKAYRDLVRSGAMTLFEMIRELGYDPETHLDEIEEANEALDERGIWLDSDPRRIAAGGSAQMQQGPDATDLSDDETEDGGVNGTANGAAADDDADEDQLLS
jgi:lambda family phage portal protein